MGDQLKNFADFGIQFSTGAVPNARGEISTTCPQCSKDRKKRNARCLSVNIDKEAWHCNHCGFAGRLGNGDARTEGRPWQRPQYQRPNPRPQLTLPQNAVDWFHARGIIDPVLLRNRIDFGSVYFVQLESQAGAVIFPYFRNGELVNRKYRTIQDKYFRLEGGCELVLYGLDDIQAGESLIWVEGEVDKLSVEAAGFLNAVSVPNGAPTPESRDYSSLFNFLDADRGKIESASRHIIAVDSDAPGTRLENELSRRLGMEKCARVRWPEGCNDANDVLVKHGTEELRWYIENAEPYPVEGVFEVPDRDAEISHLYEYGFEKGHRTGWPTLDQFYTVRPREMTIVTGIPYSGKSNWLDCLLVNLAKLHGWNFALFSPENLPLEEHMTALVEKYIKKPFHMGHTERMTAEELTAGKKWVGAHFSFIMPTSEDDWTLEKILEAAGQLCLRKGIRGLLIDPWNELEALCPQGMTETQYISKCLKRINVFKRQRGVHVWIVIHPAKIYPEKNSKEPRVPTLYDCAGSAHWYNKCDNGIVVHRNREHGDTSEVQIRIQKIRFRRIGRIGMVPLYYEPACATYRDYRGETGSPADDDWDIPS